jgi:hypothetical protein
MRLFCILFALMTVGCASTFTGWGHDAAKGALDATTDDDAKKKLSGVVGAARDEGLGPNTDAEIRTLETNAIATARAQIDLFITEEVKKLGPMIQAAVRRTIDEALGPSTQKEIGTAREALVGPPLIADADNLREELFGQPLQKDLTALGPVIQQTVHNAVTQAVQDALSPIQTAANQEAAKWKPIAIGFAVGTACLLITLIVLVYVLRSHRQLINVMLEERKRYTQGVAAGTS